MNSEGMSADILSFSQNHLNPLIRVLFEAQNAVFQESRPERNLFGIISKDCKKKKVYHLVVMRRDTNNSVSRETEDIKNFDRGETCLNNIVPCS